MTKLYRRSVSDVLLWVVLGMAGTGLPAVAGAAPIPAGPEARTHTDYNKATLTWNLATTLEAYQRVGRRDPRWDEAATKFLDMCARGLNKSLTPAQFAEAGQAVLAAGCDDPLITAIVARSLDAAGQRDQALALSRRAVNGLKTTPYPRCRACNEAVYGVYLLSVAGQKDEAATTTLLAIQWLAEGAAEPLVTNGGQRQFLGSLRNAMSRTLKDKQKEIFEAVRAQTGANPWIVNMTEATYREKLAWSTRGTGLAVDVTEDKWQGFEGNMRRAAECYAEAWRLHPEYPEPASDMIRVAMGGGVETEAPRAWFDRAVAAQMDYQPAYDALEWALVPRWGGSVDELYDFGVECLATKRFDTCVPEQFYECVRLIAREDHAGELWLRRGLYENMSTLMSGLSADSTIARPLPLWKTRQAGMAWLCGRYDDASALLKELGEAADQKVFDAELGFPLAMARSEVAAATGAMRQDVARAERLYHDGDAAGALPLFEQLVRASSDPDAGPYLRDRVATLRREVAFAKGEAVDLSVPTDLAGWHQVYGSWAGRPDGGVENLPPGHSLLACRMRLSGGYELRGAIEWPEPDTSLPAGVALGLERGPGLFWTMLILQNSDGTAHLALNYKDKGKYTVAARPRHDLLIRVWDDQFTAYVDGQRILEDQDLLTGVFPAPGPLVGFGGWGTQADKAGRVR